MKVKKRSKKGDATPVIVRFPQATVDKLDAIAAKKSTEGIPHKVTRSDVVRFYVNEGLAKEPT